MDLACIVGELIMDSPGRFKILMLYKLEFQATSEEGAVCSGQARSYYFCSGIANVKGGKAG